MSAIPAARTGRRGQVWPLAAVLVAGALVRAVLVPITHGPDFTVWDLASRATLGGVNVYAHHPAYSGGPYSYFPLFLYIELPMQWLALHAGVPFTILGKLPIVAADLGCTLLIVHELRRQGAGACAQAWGAALFVLNPLVLYNGAFYGRFDSVAVALLMLAVSLHRAAAPVRWRAASAYALAVAAKTFPLFLLPWLLRRGRRDVVRVLVAVGLVLLIVSAPYIVSSPGAFIGDLLYSAGKLPGGLSWQVVLHGLPAGVQVGVGDVLLAVFVVGVVALARIDDITVAAAATAILFLLLSKQVIEQYLLWPLPFLVLLAVGRGSRSAALLIAELTLAGMVVNAYVHPFGLQPAVINLVFAVGVAVALGSLLARERARAAGAAAVNRRTSSARASLAIGPGQSG